MGGEKEKHAPRTPPPEPAPRDDVRVFASPVRCPWCHEDVDPAGNDWVACAGCVARHHPACWDEAARCSSCGEPRRLLPDGVSRSAHPRLKEDGPPGQEGPRHLPWLGASLRLVEEQTFAGELLSAPAEAAWLDGAVRRRLGVKGRIEVRGRAVTWVALQDQGCRAVKVTLSSRQGRTVLRVEEELAPLLGGLLGGGLGGLGGGGAGVLGGLVGGGLGHQALAGLAIALWLAAVALGAVALYTRVAGSRRRSLARLRAALSAELEGRRPVPEGDAKSP